MIYVLYVIHVLVSLFLILVVLLQQGKGADLSVFGGGATQAAFGARGAATLLHKLTVGGFIAFIMTTGTIGFLQSSGSGRSVMTGAEAPATAPPVTMPLPEASEPEAPLATEPDTEPPAGSAEPPGSAPEAGTGGEAGAAPDGTDPVE